MKRIILVMLTVLLVSAIIFGGCAKPAEETPTTPTTPTEPTKPTEPVKPIEWRFASFIPPFDVYATEAEDWADQLEEATGGRVRVNFYWAESLVKMPGLADAVVSGTSDMAHVVASMFPARFPFTQFFYYPLMVFKDAPHTGRTAIALLNKYQEYRDELPGTRVLWFNCPGPTGDIVLKTKPVQTMEDLKGVKVATTAGGEIKAFNALGATVVPVIVTEQYHALETGIIDASAGEFNQFFIWKLYEVTKYRTENVRMAGRAYQTSINIESYNKLPEEIKQLFNELTDSTEMTKRVNEAFKQFSAESRGKIVENDKRLGNAPFYALPEAERERWKEVVQPVNEEWANELEAKGLPGKAFLADAIAFAEQYE